jgi:hypothetical protein
VREANGLDESGNNPPSETGEIEFNRVSGSCLTVPSDTGLHLQQQREPSSSSSQPVISVSTSNRSEEDRDHPDGGGSESASISSVAKRAPVPTKPALKLNTDELLDMLTEMQTLLSSTLPAGVPLVIDQVEVRTVFKIKF